MVMFTHGGLALDGSVVAGTTGTLNLTTAVNLGAGVPILAEASTAIRDGSILSGDGAANRTISYRVAIRAGSWDDYTATEAALLKVVNAAQSTLTLAPDDDVAPSAPVGEITCFRGTVSPVMDGAWHMQLRAFVGTYEVSCPALPWVKSQTATTVSFAPGTGSVTTRDDCTATTNFAITSGATSLGTTTYLTETAVSVTATFTANEQRDILLAWSGTRPTDNYIGIDLATAADVYLGATGGGFSSYSAVTMEGATVYAFEARSNGYTRYWFANPGGSGALDFVINTYDYTGGTGAKVYVGNIVGAAAVSTGGIVLADVPGSVRAPASVTLTRSSIDLSGLLLYTDPTMATLGWNPGVDASWKFAPSGRYAVYLKSSDLSASSGDVISVDVVLNGITQSPRTKIAAGSPSYWLPVGIVELGGNRSGRLGTAPTWTIKKNGGTITPTLVTGAPSVQLFRIEAGVTSLLQVSNFGSGIRSLTIDAPSITYPLGGVWASGTTDYTQKCNALEYPIMTPGLNAFYLMEVSANVNPISLAATIYPCWGTWAGS